MIVELALATRTAPSQWWAEDDATIATALDVLRERAERMRRR
jgi:hypothetical protein